MFIDIHDLHTDIIRHIFRSQNIKLGQDHGKFLAVITSHIAIFPHTCLQNCRHMFQGFVPFFRAVKLIIQLEIINADHQQAQRKMSVLFYFRLQRFIEIFAVQKACQFIDTGFHIYLFIQVGILYRDRADRTDRVQKGQIIRIQDRPSFLFCDHYKTNQLLFIL